MSDKPLSRPVKVAIIAGLAAAAWAVILFPIYLLK